MRSHLPPLKPVGIRQLLHNFALISQQLESDEVLLVKNRRKPEMVLLSVPKYEMFQKKIRELETQNVVKAFKEYKKLKNRNALIQLKSLADLL